MVKASAGLSAYVPALAARWDEEAPGSRWQVVDGTLCLVDVSGFTTLTERLARRGRVGAEELTDVLNDVFGAMIRLAEQRGGDVLSFGGDALLLLFVGEDHPARAVSAAIAMRASLRTTARRATSAGRIDLRTSMGVSSGPIDVFRVGTSHRELFVAGSGATAVTLLEKAADAGEILVGDATRAGLPDSWAPRRKEPGWVLSRRDPAPLNGYLPPPRPATTSAVDVPAELRDLLSRATPEPEHRTATIGFLRFEGIDAILTDEGGEAAADALGAALSATVVEAAAEGVTFLASDVDTNAVKLILAAGVPTSRSDDEGRMLRTVRRVAESGGRLPVRIGVQRGHVFAGRVGSDTRAVYTVMGDTVNVAARFMAAAPVGAVLAGSGAVEASRTVFDVTPVPALTLKGKAETVPALLVGAETGSRERATERLLPFAGRDEELGRLVNAVEASAAGQGGTILVAGEPGIGKSRLVDEALAIVSGVSALVVRAEPYGKATPYRPFRDPIRRLLGADRAENMPARLTAVLESLDPALLPLSPLVGDVAGIEVEETDETLAIERRFRTDRTVDTVVRLLELAVPGRLVLVLEDAQWSDEASSALLERLVAEATERPWVVIITRRDGEEGFSPEATSVVPLEPLPNAASEELVDAATAAEPVHELTVEAIVRRAGGNPLFLEELIRAVRQGGTIDELPGSLDALVAAEIDTLPTESRRVLRYASVLGRSFRTATLAVLLQEDGEDLDDAVRAAIDPFVEPDGPDRLRFRHAVFRDAAYESLPYSRRRELHREAARAIERLGDPVGNADTLALHYSLAHEHAAAWRFGRLAGDRTREANANAEAAVHYERALEAARGLGDVPSAERLEVWERLGDVRSRAGLFEAALDAFRTASRLAGDDPVRVASLHLKRARALERAGDFGAALRETARGRRIAEGADSGDAGRVSAQLSSLRAVVRQGQQRPREALRAAASAADEAAVLGERGALARAHGVMSWASRALGIDGAAEHDEAALALFTEMGDQSGIALATGNLGSEAYFLGRWDQAVHHYERAREAFERAGNIVDAAIVVANIGEVLVSQGHLDEAAPLLQRSVRVLRGAGFADGAAFAEVQHGRLLAARGESERAEEIFRRVYDDMAARGLEASGYEAAVHWADARVRAGRPSAALALLAAAEASAGEEVAVFAAAAARVSAMAALALDDLEDARHSVAAGLVEAERQGMPYEWALLLVAQSELERRLGLDPRPARAEAVRMLGGLGVRALPAVPAPLSGA